MSAAADLPDPGREKVGRYHHAGTTDTEREAAQRNLPRKGTQRAKVLEAFKDHLRDVGATDYEMGERLGMFRWVAGTRREELIADGWPIKDSGRRRRTDTGCNAIVWVWDSELGGGHGAGGDPRTLVGGNVKRLSRHETPSPSVPHRSPDRSTFSRRCST